MSCICLYDVCCVGPLVRIHCLKKQKTEIAKTDFGSKYKNEFVGSCFLFCFKTSLASFFNARRAGTSTNRASRAGPAGQQSAESRGAVRSACDVALVIARLPACRSRLAARGSRFSSWLEAGCCASNFVTVFGMLRTRTSVAAHSQLAARGSWLVARGSRLVRLAARGSRLAAYGSWLVARGSWLSVPRAPRRACDR